MRVILNLPIDALDQQPGLPAPWQTGVVQELQPLRCPSTGSMTRRPSPIAISAIGRIPGLAGGHVKWTGDAVVSLTTPDW